MRQTGLLILYASETGNAQDCAELLGRQGKARGLRGIRVLPADAYLSTSIEQLPHEDVLVFVASTTGQGEFPHNGRGLWKFLRRKSLPSTLLQSVRFAVFGLGDSGYPKYNYCAKLLNKRFETLGGQSLVPLGLGDDQHSHGYDASLDLWMPKLWESLGAVEIVDASALQLSPKFQVQLVADDNGSFHDRGGVIDASPTNGVAHEVGRRVRALESPLEDSLFRESPFLSANVVSNTRLTPADWFQDTRLVTLDLKLPASVDSLDPGDAVAIWPKQDTAAVHDVLARCNLRYDDVVRLRLRDTEHDDHGEMDQHLSGSPAQITCKAGHLLEGLVDVQGAPPRRTFIHAMAQLCPPGSDTAMYKERLTYLASAEGREDFYEYVMREGRNVVEVLADFPCVPMTLEWVLSFAPRLQCRYYSMASALPIEARTVKTVRTVGTVETTTLTKSVTVDLLVALVQWKTPGRRLRRGLCSKMIENLSDGDHITVSLTSGELKPPPPSVPMILVGPGTGVAPLRAFLQDRQRLVSQGDDVAPAVLFYGCRDRSKDFYFEDEWRGMVDSGVLQEVVLATSRERAPKRYVQDAIKERGDMVRDMILTRGAHVYVCGRADSMPSSVERVLGQLVGADRKLLARICHFECW